jgi:hypothetical protein
MVLFENFAEVNDCNTGAEMDGSEIDDIENFGGEMAGIEISTDKLAVACRLRAGKTTDERGKLGDDVVDAETEGCERDGSDISGIETPTEAEKVALTAGDCTLSDTGAEVDITGIEILAAEKVTF